MEESLVGGCWLCPDLGPPELPISVTTCLACRAFRDFFLDWIALWIRSWVFCFFFSRSFILILVNSLPHSLLPSLPGTFWWCWEELSGMISVLSADSGLTFITGGVDPCSSSVDPVVVSHAHTSVTDLLGGVSDFWDSPGKFWFCNIWVSNTSSPTEPACVKCGLLLLSETEGLPSADNAKWACWGSFSIVFESLDCWVVGISKSFSECSLSDGLLDNDGQMSPGGLASSSSS